MPYRLRAPYAVRIKQSVAPNKADGAFIRMEKGLSSVFVSA
jgi:hypothetical protein